MAAGHSFDEEQPLPFSGLRRKTDLQTEDLQSLAVEVTALSTRLDVLVQQIADLQEEWRPRADSWEVVGDGGDRHVVELASLIKALDQNIMGAVASSIQAHAWQALDQNIMAAVSSSIQASAAELRAELRPWIEAVEAQIKGDVAFEVSLLSSSSLPSAEVSEALQQKLGSIEAEVPLLAKAILSGSQDLTFRLDEERYLREKAEAAMEARLARMEAEVWTPLEEISTKATLTSLPSSPPCWQPSRSHALKATSSRQCDSEKDEEAWVPSAPPPTAREDVLSGSVGRQTDVPRTSACSARTLDARLIVRDSRHVVNDRPRLRPTDCTRPASPPGTYCKLLPRTLTDSASLRYS